MGVLAVPFRPSSAQATPRAADLDADCKQNAADLDADCKQNEESQGWWLEPQCGAFIALNENLPVSCHNMA